MRYGSEPEFNGSDFRSTQVLIRSEYIPCASYVSRDHFLGGTKAHGQRSLSRVKWECFCSTDLGTGFVRGDLTIPSDNFASWSTNGEMGRNEQSSLTAIDIKNIGRVAPLGSDTIDHECGMP